MWSDHQRLLIAGVLAGLLGVVAPARAAPGALKAQVERTLQEERVTGAVWATLGRDGAIHTGAAGVKNAATREPLRADSRVHVGSIAKTVLATGLLHLASTGRLDLDAPVNRYLPALRFDNPWPDHPVRVRHLLDHTAGLDDIRLWQLFSTQPTPDTPLREAFDRDPTVLAIRSRPGSQFSYSNMGFALAGMVIEAVTRERYETWLDRELLRPLGMRDSTFRFTTQDGPSADPRLAWGHHDLVTPAPAMPVYLRPAGQFTTTARDLAVFGAFLLGDGRVGDRPLVAPSLPRSARQWCGGKPGQPLSCSAVLVVGCWWVALSACCCMKCCNCFLAAVRHKLPAPAKARRLDWQPRSVACCYCAFPANGMAYMRCCRRCLSR